MTTARILTMASGLVALADGALSKDAINQVVRSHLEAIKFCYEKELVKSPGITGTVEMAWDIEKDGHVARARVARSTINNKNVEDCITIQVASWQFAAAPERSVVARYPFIFKGGSNAPPSDSPTARIWVSRTGVIELNGKQADLATVSAALADLAKRKGVVLFGRDDLSQKPHLNCAKVLEIVTQHRLPVRMATNRDFSDAAGN